MDSTQEDNYLQKITELVYDDNEIVTSTILSNLLNIKVDCAQTILEKYVKNADVPEQTDVSWTYLVTGQNEDNGILFLICKDKEIDEKKNNLKNIISQQVYSVQKNPNIDLISLANVESFTENNVKTKPLLGSVVSRNATKRKFKVIPKVVNEDKSQINETVKQNGSFDKINKNMKSSIANFCNKGSTQNSTIKSESNVKPKSKNMMANFLSKQPQSVNKDDCSSKQSRKMDNVHEDLAKDISANENHKDDSNGILVTDTVENRMEVDSEPERKKEETTETSGKESSDKNSMSKQNKKSKKRRTQGKSDQASKKRKRIIEVNNSDSDIFASSESEIEVVPDIILSDDNYEEERKVEASLPIKARRMKQITEEFMDEDGYINTVQKYVMISDDEADENKEQNPMNTITERVTSEVETTKNKKNETPAAKREISPKKSAKPKGKATKGNQNQPSIMNFFKKT